MQILKNVHAILYFFDDYSYLHFGSCCCYGCNSVSTNGINHVCEFSCLNVWQFAFLDNLQFVLFFDVFQFSFTGPCEAVQFGFLTNKRINKFSNALGRTRNSQLLSWRPGPSAWLAPHWLLPRSLKPLHEIEPLPWPDQWTPQQH